MTDLHEQRARVAGLFDQLAPGHDQGGVPWFGPIASRLVELLAPRPGERAADVGAGRGAATFPLLDAVGPDGHVTAVDLSPAMGEHLRADAATRGVGNLDVHMGDVSGAGLEPGSFDVVTASLVLFLDPDPDPGSTLRSWVGLGRPGSGRIGESLAADRADDGLLHLTQQVRYTTGRVA